MNLSIFKEIRLKLLTFYLTLLISFGVTYYLLTYPFAHEAIYRNPIQIHPDLSVVVRNDEGGQGHFGASRNRGRTHTGIDIEAPLGTEIHASKSGRVIRSFDNGGYGEFIEILHPDQSVSRYAHLSERIARRGDWVHSNQIIGRVGKTGNASGDDILPHVHFEIRVNDQPFDPQLMIQNGKPSKNVD